MKLLANILMKAPRIYSIARRSKQIVFGFPEPELELLRFLVDPDRAAIDVGAHSGLYTAELLRLCSSVIAIEAIPELASNIARTYPAAQTINAAASFEEGQATLYIPIGQPGLSTITATNPVVGKNCREVHVNTVTLDRVTDLAVGFVKIDVEGNELNVLRGAKSLLQRDKPVLLIEAEERHRHNAVASLYEFLSPLGYSGLMLENGKLRPLEVFDLDRDQNIDSVSIKELNSGNYKGRYINNFVFIA